MENTALYHSFYDSLLILYQLLCWEPHIFAAFLTKAIVCLCAVSLGGRDAHSIKESYLHFLKGSMFSKINISLCLM